MVRPGNLWVLPRPPGDCRACRSPRTATLNRGADLDLSASGSRAVVEDTRPVPSEGGMPRSQAPGDAGRASLQGTLSSWRAKLGEEEPSKGHTKGGGSELSLQGPKSRSSREKGHVRQGRQLLLMELRAEAPSIHQHRCSGHKGKYHRFGRSTCPLPQARPSPGFPAFQTPPPTHPRDNSTHLYRAGLRQTIFSPAQCLKLAGTSLLGHRLRC